MRQSNPSRWQTFGGLLLLFLPATLLMAPGLLSDRSYAFRDGGHYYPPLFKWVQENWDGHLPPLWNWQENLGSPAVADATASIFYPGKLLFSLPIPFEFAYKLYLLGHLWLCGATAYYFARQIHASRSGAYLAGLTYSLGGHVLFQYCNVIYLVSAAWLPLSLASSPGFAVSTAPRVQLLLPISLAMMVLGGDAQMAYLTLLMGLIHTLAQHKTRGWSPALQLFIAAALATCLAAVQILPTRSALETSSRAATNTAHTETIYDFSVGPWRLAECVWPNIAGKAFPIHRRWANVIPAERRFWTPTLYAGIVPLLLAVAAFRLGQQTGARRPPRSKTFLPFRVGSRMTSRATDLGPSLLPPEGSCFDSVPTGNEGGYLSWLAFIAILGSFGSYGLVWLFRELRYDITGNSSSLGWSDPVGGVYWWLATLLPGFDHFRYPAKLWTVAALALAILAAGRWEAAWTTARRSTARSLATMGTASMGLAMGLWFTRFFWQAQLGAKGSSDILFGPLDVTGASFDLISAPLHTAIVCGICGWLWRTDTKWRRAAVVAVTAVELLIAQAWLLPLTDNLSSSQATTSSTTSHILAAKSFAQVADPAWKTTTSEHRLSQIVARDRQSVRPRYTLLTNNTMLGSAATIDNIHFAEFWRQWNQRHDLSELDPFFSPQIVRSVIFQDELPDLPSPAQLHTATATILAHDLEHVVVIEGATSEQQTEIRSALSPADRAFERAFDLAFDGAADSLTITHRDSRSMTLNCELTAPGMLVIWQTPDPHWTAKLAATDTRLTIHRGNRVAQALLVPQGQHTIQFSYHPQHFYLGAAVSLVTWCGVVLWWGTGSQGCRARKLESAKR